VKSFYLILIPILIIPNLAFSQNLVLNPSFEDTIPCAVYPGEPQLRPYFWFEANGGSTDFFNTSNNCPYGGGVPQSVMGYQFPENGSAFFGFSIWGPTAGANYREYIEGFLADTLQLNHTYLVSFYVSPADNCNYFTDDIGAYFSVDSVKNWANGSNLPYAPQVENTQGNVLNDTLNWMLVSGTFTAQGGEKFITIGNFKDDANTTLVNFQSGPNDFGYYFIDDVSVVDCTASGINEPYQLNLIIQNPVTDELRFSISEPIKEATLINSLGAIVLSRSFELPETTHDFNVASLPTGIYLLRVTSRKNNVGLKKMLKL